MVFKAKVSGDELIRLYSPYSARWCGLSVLVRPNESYRIKYDGWDRIRVDADTARDTMGETAFYVLGHDPSNPSYTDVHRDNGEWLGIKNDEHLLPLSFPLRGFYRVRGHEAAAFDRLLQTQGYYSVCEYIDRKRNPTMFRALLEQQARREVVPSLWVLSHCWLSDCSVVDAERTTR
jgi:hypothetical protein